MLLFNLPLMLQIILWQSFLDNRIINSFAVALQSLPDVLNPHLTTMLL
jgi:hypothetical protein